MPAPICSRSGSPSGFGFLANTAGFDVSQNLIPYSGSDTYTRVFLVGLLNTLLVSVIGIFFATIIGFLVALGRLSPNWLLSRISGGYVELIRNLPLLFQILFWYLAVLARVAESAAKHLAVRQLLSQQPRLRDSEADRQSRLGAFRARRSLIAIVGSLLLRRYARRQLFEHGRLIRIWPYVLGLLIGLPLLTSLVFGAPVTFEFPELKGFNFSGGSRVIPEFVALTLALSTYTAAFIAEIVRAGIQSVHKGQMEAGASLGLPRGSTLAADRGAAGDARHPAAAHQPVSQSHQELVAGGGDRISRPGLGIRRHDAEPDRAGDRNHRASPWASIC